MIIIKSVEDLLKNKKLFRNIKSTNYQQTYENIYSIHLSNPSATTFIDDNKISTFIYKSDKIMESALNIEPVIGVDDDIQKYISEVSKISKKILYFPLVYEDSKFYNLLKGKIYNYERLYTSLASLKKENLKLNKNLGVRENICFPYSKIKKIEKDLYIKYYTGKDVKKIISEIEIESWKHNSKQDMVTKNEQLIYYNELIKQGIAKIAIAYTRSNDELVAYRIDAVHSNKVHVLKNSYKEKFKKYSIGTYMLIYDLYTNYSDYKYIDLYGGPGLSKELIEGRKINRYDMFYGTGKEIEELEKNRKSWDKKNYDVFLNGKSLKEVFNKKENILVATSCFGLGPVGKLNAIIESAIDKYNWYATGEKFDIGIFKKNIFKDCCFSLDKESIKEFVEKYNIKYAIVVLKNKMARLLVEIGVKVVYVDSLPFMWTEKDAKEGKVPYNVDVYCAQKTLDLNDTSKKIFSNVKNLVWVNPIINKNEFSIDKYSNFVILNLGGLHSNNTDGLDYVDAVVVPIIKKLKNKKILITTSTESMLVLKEHLKDYKNILIKNLKQEEFINYVRKTKIFITSPGLTTILENCNNRDSVIFLPPQNISQFYNVNYGKKVFKKYKEITWNNDSLTLEKFSMIKDQNEHEIILSINKKISEIKNDKNFTTYVEKIIDSKYITSENYRSIDQNGSDQVIEELEKLIKSNKL